MKWKTNPILCCFYFSASCFYFSAKGGRMLLGKTTGLKPKVGFLIQLLLIVSWMTNLALTDAYVSVYALCTVIAVIALCYNSHHHTSVTGKAKIPVIVLSAFFSLSTLLANYPLFQILRSPDSVSASTNAFFNVFNAIIAGGGGTCCRVSYPGPDPGQILSLQAGAA